MKKASNSTVKRLNRIRARRAFVKSLPSIIADSYLLALFILPPIAFILAVWAGIWALSIF